MRRDQDELFRVLLKTMFNGWIIHEQSWDAIDEKYRIEPEAAMTQAVGGDSVQGYILYLFDHWGDDIKALAPNFGLALVRDDNNKLIIREDVPTPPEPREKYFFNTDTWVWDELKPDDPDDETIDR